MLGRGVPIRASEIKGAENPDILLKHLCTDSLAHKHYPKLQQRENISKVARDILEETELYGFRVRSAIVSVFNPPSKQHKGAGRCQI